MSNFVLDIQSIRDQARKHIEEGAVTPSYKADKETVIRLLNDALATELVCILRYRNHYHTAQGIHSEAVAQEFLEHANEEQEHADMIAARITQLGGRPLFNPDHISARSHTDYAECTSLEAMIRENLVAERIAIETYSEMIRYVSNDDPTTRRMFETILAKEEEHADELADLLATFDVKRTAH